ncbi:MAG TPA: TVP38/TMEM64 family protein [Chthoniobacterales bacterium]|nr:TVP38/TMEM64 family protein [Chthoniobacterales bacterium]
MKQVWLEWMTRGLEWVEHAGWLGWLGFIVIYTLTCVFFLPGSVLTVGAGAIYGFWGGTLLVSISNLVGAVVNFLTSRYLLRGWLNRKFADNKKFHALDHAIANEGWRIILLSRISPVVPHSIVSYACGLTKLSLAKFSFASWVGFVPISAAYSYLGAFVGKFARASAGLPHGTESRLTWLFYAVGLVVTIVVTVWSTRVAARALKTKVTPG